jgi:predicted nucleotidyltransferase/HEPN domain-containing protein
MKTTLTHLPIIKQQELQEIAQLISQRANVEMIILFGSYARGDWVEEYADDGVHFQYQSDMDLLVIVGAGTTFEQRRLEREIEKAIKQFLVVKTPVSLITHDIKFVNRRLTKAQYFFSEIKTQGILLYDSNRFQLKEPRELSNKERHHLATEDFESWFPSAVRLFEIFNFVLGKKYYADAAFLLHQVTERLYSTILLVFTRYKPNTHKLKELRILVNTLDPRFIKVFALSTAEEQRRFELLCDAYVDARYKKSYLITEEELLWLSHEVQNLSQLTDTLCQEKIRSFLPNTDMPA